MWWCNGQNIYITFTFFEAFASELIISWVVPWGKQQKAISQSSIAATES